MTALVETVGRLLGLRRQLSSRLDLAQMIRDGLPHGAVERVKGLLDLSDRELAAAMGVSQKTVSRLKKNKSARVNPVAGDRLYRMARLYALTRDVTEDRFERVSAHIAYALFKGAWILVTTFV